MKAGFLEKLIERLGRIGPEDVQNYFLRLAQEKGFLETVFNADPGRHHRDLIRKAESLT
jgi:hypothetical protein